MSDGGAGAPDRDPESGGTDPDASDPGGSDGADGPGGRSAPDATADAETNTDRRAEGPRRPDAAPLSDLARRVADRREGGDGVEAGAAGVDASMEGLDDLAAIGPPDPDEDPFEEMAVGEIDEETLWSSLESGDPASVEGATDIGGESPVGGDHAPGAVGDAGPVTADVPKDEYCQSCPYLDDPPALSCTHEGTEIVAVLNSEEFRVRNCPIVEERDGPP